MEVWQITTTVASREDADRIAASLVADRLAACVQIDGPIHSHYWWNEAVVSEPEWRCTIKTAARRLDDCIAGLRQRHPYQVPEVLAAPVAQADAAYAAWLDSQVG